MLTRAATKANCDRPLNTMAPTVAAAKRDTEYFFFTATYLRFGRLRGTEGSVHTCGFFIAGDATPRNERWTRESMENCIREVHPEYLVEPWRFMSGTIVELTRTQAEAFKESLKKRYEVPFGNCHAQVFPL